MVNHWTCQCGTLNTGKSCHKCGATPSCNKNLKPCPRCGAEVEYYCEDLSDEAITEVGIHPDEWVECTKCDYAKSREFHEESQS